MEKLTAILNEYGWTALIALLILGNASKIATFIERVLSRVWPTFAEQRRVRSERAAAADERIDTILALKEMLVEYRESLKDSTTERRQLQDRLYKLVERYERLDAQTIEILRDISAAIRLQTARLDRIGVRIGVYNSDKDDKSQTVTAE